MTDSLQFIIVLVIVVAGGALYLYARRYDRLERKRREDEAEERRWHRGGHG